MKYTEKKHQELQQNVLNLTLEEVYLKFSNFKPLSDEYKSSKEDTLERNKETRENIEKDLGDKVEIVLLYIDSNNKVIFARYI